ncbi:MAG: hypothetical protein ABEI58_00945 [Candidatus Nanohaloarchaea archaeon]
MANDFLEAARSSEDESSEDRYNRLKKKESEVDQRSEAEKRFEKLKEEAKEEFIQRQRRKEQEQQEEEDSTGDADGFITH